MTTNEFNFNNKIIAYHYHFGDIHYNLDKKTFEVWGGTAFVSPEEFEQLLKSKERK